MSWQEAVLKKVHFNALLAAIGVVGGIFWLSDKNGIGGIAALIISVYFFFLLLIHFYNNYKHNVSIERQEDENKRYLEQQNEIERQIVEIWYASTDSTFRTELKKLLTFDIVGNDPCARKCDHEKRQFFYYDSFKFELPGSNLLHPRYAVNCIYTNSGNEIYYINPHLYQLIMTD